MIEDFISNIPVAVIAIIPALCGLICLLAMRQAFKIWMLQEEQKKRIKSDSFVPGNINTLKKEMK